MPARYGVHHAIDVRPRLVDAAVNGEACCVEAAIVAVDLAVEVHLDQARGGDLMEQIAVIVDQEALRIVGNAHRHVVLMVSVQPKASVI